MPLPTLLKKGVLQPGMGEKQEDLNKYIGIDYILEWFDKRIVNVSNIKSVDDKIIIVESATGSGKSTVLPTELYLKFNKQLQGNIIVTQPRVLTTISIPNTIVNVEAYQKKYRSDNQGIEFGKNIGYATKEYIKKPLERGILFCTIGVLLQYLKNMDKDTFLKKYKIIMLDEAHDRSLNLDVIFYYMKDLFKNTPIDKCPFLVIMSATLDVNKYTKYFQTKTVFRVKGTSYPIEDIYLKYDTDNIIVSTINIIKNIHLNNQTDDISSSDIVVFIPGQSFIKKIKEKINELNETLDKKMIPIALDSTIFKASNIDYQNVFADIKTLYLDIDGKISKHRPTRKVIIGTNAIETGITIESLKYCIDLGLVNQLEYNPVVCSNILMVKPITKAMSQQRRGRVGRIQAGKFYPIYTKKVFDNLLNIQYPEILTNDMSISILNIIIVKYKDIIEKYKIENKYDKKFSIENSYNNIKLLKNIDISKLNLLDEPTNIAITSSLEKLYLYGAIYANGYPTQLGLLSNKIRMLSIENIKMILSGFYYGCNISDLITIACFIQTTKQNIVDKKFKSFNNQFNNINSMDIFMNMSYNKLKSRLFISCEMIDFLLFFYKFKKIIKEYNNNIIKIKEFCNDNKVNYQGLMIFIENRDDVLRDFLFNMNMNPFTNSNIDLDDLLKSYQSNENIFEEFIEEIIKIKKCIYEGYKLNTATYDSNLNEYISDYNGNIVKSDSYLLKNLPHIDDGKKFIDLKPKKIIYDSLIIKKNISNNFEFHISNAISVMSGYVDIDNTFY